MQAGVGLLVFFDTAQSVITSQEGWRFMVDGWSTNDIDSVLQSPGCVPFENLTFSPLIFCPAAGERMRYLSRTPSPSQSYSSFTLRRSGHCLIARKTFCESFSDRVGLTTRLRKQYSLNAATLQLWSHCQSYRYESCTT